VSERAFYPDLNDGSSKDGGAPSSYERVNNFFSIQRFNESRGDTLLHPSYFLFSLCGSSARQSWQWKTDLYGHWHCDFTLHCGVDVNISAQGFDAND
jgi:hypothetical protein